jgi:hypothetical protein
LVERLDGRKGKKQYQSSNFCWCPFRLMYNCTRFMPVFFCYQ